MRKKKDKKCPTCGKSNCGCKGYAQGTEMISPMGYYLGTPEAAPPQPQEEINVGQGARAQARIVPEQQGPTAGQRAGQMAASTAMNEGMGAISEPVSSFAGDQALALKAQTIGLNPAEVANLGGAVPTKAMMGPLTQEAATKAATDTAVNAAGGMASSALSGFGGAAVGDLLTKGTVDEKTLLKGGLAMGANMLLPGSGFLVGPALTALGLEDGTTEVKPKALAAPLTDYKKTSTGAVADADYSRRIQAINEYRQGIPNYQQLPGGGMADMNASIYFEEMNKQAQRENAKRIRDAMGEQ